MKIQSGAVDGAITAGLSDSITDMPEILGAFLPMLMALPAQPMPDQVAVSFTEELPLANQSDQELVVDSVKEVDEDVNASTASTELMAMLNAATPAPIKPEYSESEEPLTPVDNPQVSTSVAIPIPVFKPDRQSMPPENPLKSGLQPQLTQTPLPVTNPLSVVKTANKQDNAISKEPLPVEFVFPDEQIAELCDNKRPIVTAPAMTLIKQSIAVLDQKNSPPMALALEPVSKELQAIDSINPVVADKPSELNLCHTVLNTTVDFFNKQLITIDNPAPVASPNMPTIAVDGQIMREKKIVLEALQFNPSQLVSLKTGNYSARLKVYPPDAGQITADILIHKGTTDLTLRCENPGVKQFLEAHLQPLRESFLQSTLQLGEVVIHHQSTGSEPSNQQPSHQSAFAEYYNKQPSTNALGGRVTGDNPQPSSSRSIIDTWV